jgi:hypothetical protein
MPLPRKKDAGSSGAPVLNLLSARVKLFDVEEYESPYTVTRKSDGAEFTLDPGFKCTVEVVDDGADGSDNGVQFFEQFKYKQAKLDKANRFEPAKSDDWFNQQNSKLGALTEVVKPGYFDDDSIPELGASDLEGFEMMCRVKPKNNPSTGAITGSTIDWETMQALPGTKMASVAAAQPEDPNEEDFEDIPF